MTEKWPEMTRKMTRNDPKIRIVISYLFSSSVEIEVDEFEPSVSEALVPTESRISNLRPTFFNLILFSFWKLHPFFFSADKNEKRSQIWTRTWNIYLTPIYLYLDQFWLECVRFMSDSGWFWRDGEISLASDEVGWWGQMRNH